MKLGPICDLRHRTLGVLAAAAGGVALWAPSAHAAFIPRAAPCTAAPASQAFASWGDANEYELVPGGNFAGSGSGWTLTGGAKIVSVTVPFNLGAGTVGALYLPPGSTATSPTICVDPSDPTYRFLGDSTAGSANLLAQAVYTTALGLKVPVTLSATQLPSGWGPLPALQTGAAPASVLSGGTAQMSLRFQSSGDSLIDDVFVDPRMRMG